MRNCARGPGTNARDADEVPAPSLSGPGLCRDVLITPAGYLRFPTAELALAQEDIDPGADDDRGADDGRGDGTSPNTTKPKITAQTIIEY